MNSRMKNLSNKPSSVASEKIKQAGPKGQKKEVQEKTIQVKKFQKKKAQKKNTQEKKIQEISVQEKVTPENKQKSKLPRKKIQILRIQGGKLQDKQNQEKKELDIKSQGQNLSLRKKTAAPKCSKKGLCSCAICKMNKPKYIKQLHFQNWEDLKDQRLAQKRRLQFLRKKRFKRDDTEFQD